MITIFSDIKHYVNISAETPAQRYERILKQAIRNCGEPEVKDMILDKQETYKDADGNVKAVVNRNSDGEITSMEIVTHFYYLSPLIYIYPCSCNNYFSWSNSIIVVCIFANNVGWVYQPNRYK